jgi:hypothetical protein
LSKCEIILALRGFPHRRKGQLSLKSDFPSRGLTLAEQLPDTVSAKPLSMVAGAALSQVWDADDALFGIRDGEAISLSFSDFSRGGGRTLRQSDSVVGLGGQLSRGDGGH